MWGIPNDPNDFPDIPFDPGFLGQQRRECVPTVRRDITHFRNWPCTQYAASYKGIPFEVVQDQLEAGRRVQTHEFPSAEVWRNEDLGRAKRTQNVAGFIDGDDADVQIQVLAEVCSTQLPGLLVLPLRPPVRARCGPFKSTFIADELGRFTFEAVFILEPDIPSNIIPSRSLIGRVASTGQAAETQARNAFDSSFNGLDVPAVARDAAATTVGLLTDRVASGIGKMPMAAEDRAEIDWSIADLAANATTLVYTGQKAARRSTSAFIANQATADSGLSARLAALFAAINTAATPDDAAPLMLSLGSFAAQTIASKFLATPSVLAEVALTEVLAAYVRRLALINATRSTCARRFLTRGEAASARAAIAQALNIEIAAASDPVMAGTLLDLRGAAVAYLSTAAIELPKVEKIKLRAMAPAAVLASALYADASRDREIVERNELPHPLFVGPGTIDMVQPA